MKIVDVTNKFYQRDKNKYGKYTIIHLPLAFLIFIILLITIGLEVIQRRHFFGVKVSMNFLNYHLS